MKNKIVLMLLLLAGIAGWSNELRPTRPGYSALFWKVEGKGVNGYLLASTPFIVKKDYPLPAPVEKAFKEISTLILPMYVPADEEKRMGALMLQKGIYIGEKSLKDDLSPTTYAELQRSLKEQGQDTNVFAKVKTWMASLLLTMSEIQRLGYNAEENLLSYLQKFLGKKKTIGLIQYTEMFDLLENLSLGENELYLRMSMQNCRFMRKKHKLLRDSWIRGDLDTFEKELQTQWNGFPELRDFQKRFDSQRKRMVHSRLGGIMKTNPDFFIVFDVENICGKDGLLHWFNQNGYRLLPIR